MGGCWGVVEGHDLYSTIPECQQQCRMRPLSVMPRMCSAPARSSPQAGPSLPAPHLCMFSVPPSLSPVCVEHHDARVLLVPPHRQPQLASLLRLEGPGRGAHSLATKRHTPRRAWQPCTDRTDKTFLAAQPEHGVGCVLCMLCFPVVTPPARVEVPTVLNPGANTVNPFQGALQGQCEILLPSTHCRDTAVCRLESMRRSCTATPECMGESCGQCQGPHQICDPWPWLLGPNGAPA
jgi:hypothetical protein